MKRFRGGSSTMKRTAFPNSDSGVPSSVFSGGRRRKIGTRRRRGNRRSKQKGGSVGLVSVIKDALVPFSLFALQSRKKRSVKRHRR